MIILDILVENGLCHLIFKDIKMTFDEIAKDYFNIGDNIRTGKTKLVVTLEHEAEDVNKLWVYVYNDHDNDYKVFETKIHSVVFI